MENEQKIHTCFGLSKLTSVLPKGSIKERMNIFKKWHIFTRAIEREIYI